MISELHIQTALRGDITYLEKAYCSQPFKIANITEDKKSETVQLMLMNSSPGILDGDEYRMKIDLAKRTTLHLHTQSYQRLFSMKKGASQKIEAYLEPGSSFYFIQHPSVPHESSIFTAANKIFLSANCKLVWGEVLTCGRKLNGEIFKFSKYHNITEIFINNKLVIRENLLIYPTAIDVNAIGQLEGYTHQATLIYVDEKCNPDKMVNAVIDLLSVQHGIALGVTRAPVNGLIVRLLGQKAEQLYDCLKTICAEIINAPVKNIQYAV